MLLCDKIEYDIKTVDKGLTFNVRYCLTVHNFNKKKALISLKRLRLRLRTNELVIDEENIIKFEELKIPNKLTAKDWIEKLFIKHDPLLIKDSYNEDLIKLTKILKIKFKIMEF